MGGGVNLVALQDYGAEWLKQFPVIGCRDEGTVKMLERSGIAAYLTGCFTLTLKPFPNVNRHGKILLVDAPAAVVDFVKEHTKKEVLLVSHDYKKSTLPQEVIDYALEHDKKEIIPTSHYPAFPDTPHSKCAYKGNWSYRRALIEGLLRFYQGASLIVTNRLHVSLPCLALGTPVLLINHKNKLLDYRLSTFLPYVNQTTPEDLLSGKHLFNFDEPEANPGGHEKLAEKIRISCTNFINSCESNPDTSLIDVETWLDGQKRNLRLKRFIRMLLPDAKLPNPKLADPRLYTI